MIYNWCPQCGAKLLNNSACNCQHTPYAVPYFPLWNVWGNKPAPVELKKWEGLRVVNVIHNQGGIVTEESKSKVLVKLDRKWCGLTSQWFSKRDVEEVWK